MTWMRVLLNEWRDRRDIDLHILVLRKGADGAFQFRASGAEFHVVPTVGMTRAPSLFWMDTVLIRKVLRRISPDVIHAWGTERGAALVATRLGWPCIVTMQGLLNWYASAVPPTPYERLAALMETMALRRARLVTTESRFAVEHLRHRHTHLDVQQVEHSPHPAFFNLRRTPQTRKAELLFVGHMDFRKGGDVLLDSLGLLDAGLPWGLRHAGSADAGLQVRLDALKDTGRCELLGSLKPEELTQALARATLLVMPTRADTSPNAVKEAVVAGVPVIATNVGGIPDYVVHGSNGLLIPEPAPRLLADAILEAAKDRIFCEGAVEPATHQRMREYLSPARMGESFLAAYRKALQGCR